MGRSFQQSVFAWYGVDIPDGQAHGVFKPLMSMRSLGDDEAWGPTQWMYFMQGQPVAEPMRLAMLALCWEVALHLKDRAPHDALAWLSLWENLHHTRAEYSKRTGCDEYALIAKFDFVPRHSESEIQQWSSWLTDMARAKTLDGSGFAELVPFMAYYPWLQAITTASPNACERIEDAIDATFCDSDPAVFYAQHQWVVWCFRHRHPNDTYDSKSLMHRLFSERSLHQLACFWHDGAKGHPDGLLPSDIPKIWQRPLFAGSDITDAEMPEWQQAWVDVISTPQWARRLSFWVAMVRVRRQNRNPAWIERIVQEHPSEWKFFETMHSWISQMPPFLEPVMTTKNMETFIAESLNYEYTLARALWVMYNSEETIEVLPLPNLED